MFMALNTAQAHLRTGSWSRALKVASFLLASLLGGLVTEAAERGPVREYQVKAVFLYNFAQFVEWPAGAFESHSSPLVIGILGQDPFGAFLDQTIEGERANGRPLVVTRFRNVGEVQQCHILFVSGSEGGRAEQIAAALKGRSILTVCDWEGFARAGAMVRFMTERSRVRLRINLESAKAAGLNISSKLLRSAESVTLEKTSR